MQSYTFKILGRFASLYSLEQSRIISGWLFWLYLFLGKLECSGHGAKVGYLDGKVNVGLVLACWCLCVKDLWGEMGQGHFISFSLLYFPYI